MKLTVWGNVKTTKKKQTNKYNQIIILSILSMLFHSFFVLVFTNWSSFSHHIKRKFALNL